MDLRGGASEQVPEARSLGRREEKMAKKKMGRGGVEFVVENSKSHVFYDDAVMAAVARSLMRNGSPVRISVYAHTRAGAVWWERNFGGDPVILRRFERDAEKPIDTLVIRAR